MVDASIRGFLVGFASEPGVDVRQVRAVSKALGGDVVLLAEGVVGSNAKWYFYTRDNDGELFMGGITAVVPISLMSICCRSADPAALPHFLELVRRRLSSA